MSKIIVFEIGGRFAHFSDPLTNPKYLKRTFNIIPKTTIFGLLGSIIGLNGYSTLKRGFPEFYEKLKDKNVFIKPINFPFSKKIIKYNSLNSFANNDHSNPKNVNIIMQEEILIKPQYVIGVEVDENDEIDKKLINNIKNERSFYHLYLGKNEFFSSLKFKGMYNFKNINKKEIKTSSIFPIYFVEDSPSEIDSIIQDRMINELIIDDSNNVFRAVSIKIGFIRDTEEPINIKEKFINSFKELETGEIVCLF